MDKQAELLGVSGKADRAGCEERAAGQRQGGRAAGRSSRRPESAGQFNRLRAGDLAISPGIFFQFSSFQSLSRVRLFATP